jgi:hypothetical protein
VGAVESNSIAYQVGTVTGIVVVAVLVVALVGRAYRRGFGGPRWLDGAAAVAAVAVAVFAFSHYAGQLRPSDRAADPWSTQAGIEMRTGFLDGCRGNAAVDCDCTFEHITANHAYETPAGFATLVPAVQRYQQTGDPSTFPTVMVDAVRACVR